MAKMTKEEKKAAKAAKKAEKANAPKDVELNTTIIKSVVAVICAAAVCITATNCIGKIADAKIAAAEAYLTDENADGTADDGSYVDGSADYVDPAVDGTTDGTATDGTVTEDATAAGDAATDTTANAGDSKQTATNSTTSAPKTVAEVLNYYNTATAKAAKAAVPFTKDRTTSEKSFDAGVALKTFKSIVYKFMGVGDDNKFSKTVTAEDKDSYFKYFKASTLKESDVTAATCTESGGNYTITIKIKDGSSKVEGGKVVNSNNAPLDRSGLACGDNDKDYWDHKTAENMMSAIDEVPGATSANINEKYSNAVITAVINAKTGNIVSLSAKFDFHVDLSNIMGSSGVAEASSTVNMKNFKW